MLRRTNPKPRLDWAVTREQTIAQVVAVLAVRREHVLAMLREDAETGRR